MDDGTSLPQAVPKVSVLMAVYNGERYLQTALDSILKQSFRDFELIIVDDASTDGTASLLDACSDLRISRYRNPKNLGLTKSLNVGLGLTNGSYIARMDADDVSHPDRLAIQLAFLEHHLDHVLVGTSYRLIDEAGKPFLTNIKPMDDLELRWVSHMRTALEHSSVMFRRLGSDGTPYLYDERYRTAQDYEFWLRLLKDGKGRVLKEVLVDYRVHPANITASDSESQVEYQQAIALRHATETYDLSPAEERQVAAWLRLFLTPQPFSDSEFADALRGLKVLADHFIARHKLSGSAARFIRARAAGQFWYGVLPRRRPPSRPNLSRLVRLLWIGRETLPSLLLRFSKGNLTLQDKARRPIS